MEVVIRLYKRARNLKQVIFFGIEIRCTNCLTTRMIADTNGEPNVTANTNALLVRAVK